MGWTYCHATHYKAQGNKGTVDRAAEVRSQFGSGYTVLKDTVRGSVYYGALEDKASGKVTAVVALTHIDNGSYCNFGYKIIHEEMGPVESRCPASILSLLSVTDSAEANRWRERCSGNSAHARRSARLGRLPVGTTISFTLPDKEGETRLLKCPSGEQFRTPWWKVIGKNAYFPKKDIPLSFKVVSKPGKEYGPD